MGINNKITYDEVKREFENKGCILISKSYDWAKRLTYKCKNGHITKTFFHNFKRNHGCILCSVSKKYDIDFVKETLFKKGYILISKRYAGVHKKIKFICNNGHVNQMSFSQFLRGVRCSVCTKNKKKDIKYVKEKFKNAGLILLSKEYLNNSTPLKYKCIKKGHICESTLANITAGHGCLVCKESKGELAIERFLIENQIEFYRQKRFKDCVLKRILPFDFYLPNKNVAIEFDGRQHFDGWNNNYDSLLLINKRDEVKTNYCIDKDMKLIRINYKEIDKINYILMEELKCQKK